MGKALAEHGVSPKTTKLFSSGELVNDEPLKSMGEGAIGIISGWHYSWVHKSPENAKFVKGINEMLNGRNPDQFTVSRLRRHGSSSTRRLRRPRARPMATR